MASKGMTSFLPGPCDELWGPLEMLVPVNHRPPSGLRLGLPPGAAPHTEPCLEEGTSLCSPSIPTSQCPMAGEGAGKGQDSAFPITK